MFDERQNFIPPTATATYSSQIVGESFSVKKKNDFINDLGTATRAKAKSVNKTNIESSGSLTANKAYSHVPRALPTTAPISTIVKPGNSNNNHNSNNNTSAARSGGLATRNRQDSHRKSVTLGSGSNV